MHIDELIQSYQEQKTEWETLHEKAETQREQVNTTVKDIHEIIRKDFEIYLNSINAQLPQKKQVTKWQMYTDGNGNIFYNGTATNLSSGFGILAIGNEICKDLSSSDSQLPLPNYLKKSFQTFTSKYSFPVHIFIINDSPAEDK